MTKVHIHCYNDYHDCEICGSDFNTLYTITGDLGEWEMGDYAACFGQSRSSTQDVLMSIAKKVAPDTTFELQDYVCDGKGGWTEVPAKINGEVIEGDITEATLTKYLKDNFNIEIAWESEEAPDFYEDDDYWDE